MKEKTIFIISIGIAIFGLGFLFLYAEEFNSALITSMDETNVEEEVVIRGVVNKVSVQDKVIFLELEGKRIEKTDIVLFSSEDILVQEGDYVEVSGLVEEYEGKKEVIADSIVLK